MAKVTARVGSARRAFGGTSAKIRVRNGQVFTHIQTRDPVYNTPHALWFLAELEVESGAIVQYQLRKYSPEGRPVNKHTNLYYRIEPDAVAVEVLIDIGQVLGLIRGNLASASEEEWKNAS